MQERKASLYILWKECCDLRFDSLMNSNSVHARRIFAGCGRSGLHQGRTWIDEYEMATWRDLLSRRARQPGSKSKDIALSCKIALLRTIQQHWHLDRS